MRNTKFAVHANSAKATAIPHDVDAVRLNVYSESFLLPPLSKRRPITARAKPNITMPSCP